MSQFRVFVSACALVCLGAVGAARGQAAGQDREFVEKAAVGGMTEVEAGKLAQSKASSAEVKQFAAKLVDDHSRANDELKQLAMRKGASVPAAPDKSAQRDLDQLGKQQGAAFDRAYMKQMVSDHEKTVALFEKEAKSGKDPDLKAWAQKTLPVLQGHHQQAVTVNDALKSAK